MIVNDRYGRSCFMSFIKLDSALNPSSRQVIWFRKADETPPKDFTRIFVQTCSNSCGVVNVKPVGDRDSRPRHLGGAP